MIQSLKKLLFPIALLLAIAFVIFMVNQLSGLYLLLSDFNPLLGKVVLGILSIALGVLMLSPVLIYASMPKPLRRPKNALEVARYQKKLLKRLQSNRVLISEGLVPQKESDLEEAIALLNKRADQVIAETATMVFLTTSVSQNGKLDAFTVFATQVRMVWKVAHIYYQRPTIRDLIYIYSNVGASAFLATEIEDLDITRQIEPVATALFRNASGKSVPLLGPTAQIVLDSLLEGSTNAFLTLRVGIMTRRFCGELGVVDLRQIRREAFREAGVYLKNITMKSSGRIISGLLKATRNAGVDTIKSGWEGIKTTGGKVRDRIFQVGKTANPFKKEQAGPKTR